MSMINKTKEPFPQKICIEIQLSELIKHPIKNENPSQHSTRLDKKHFPLVGLGYRKNTGRRCSQSINRYFNKSKIF